MSEKMKIGFVVNPIAGMGGKVGLKGTDGVLDEAVRRGAEPVAPVRAFEMLSQFYEIGEDVRDRCAFVTCAGVMGEDELRDAGFTDVCVVYEPRTEQTSAEDTRDACRSVMDEGVELLVFCGGDGTARDVLDVVGQDVPLLGVPSGVKMHSGVFGVNVEASAKMLKEFILGTLTVGEAEVMDLDEERYRLGEWNIKLFGIAKGIVEPTYVQVGKTSYEAVSDDAIKEELAEHLEDEMKQHADTLFLMGSGGTIDFIAKTLGFENTLLGIDAVYDGRVVGVDLDERGLLRLLDEYPKAIVVLSPIGSQGFILGRGNLQLSPKVIRKVGIDNILVVSTPSKLAHTPVLRVDTGDHVLDEELFEKEFFMVVVGYRLSRVSRVQRT